MWILPFVGYAGVLFGFGFLTLAIGTYQSCSLNFYASLQLTINRSLASGLYYLSELVEEHSVFTKKLLTRIIYGIIVVQILLALVDRFPPFLSLLSIGSHAVYAGNLRYFPTVRLTDPILMLSCGNVQQSPSS